MRKGTILVLFVFLLAIPVEPDYEITTSNIYKDNSANSHQKIVGSTYTTHEPIVVTSNEGFASLGFPGFGTYLEPFIIAGYNITTSGNCIYVEDTNAYFVIRDCYLGGGFNGDGIILSNVSHAMIYNNSILQREEGIVLTDSLNLTINNNTILGKNNGIRLTSSYNNTIGNNSISQNGFGLVISNGGNNTIKNNTISKTNFSGIHISSSSNNTSLLNRISNCYTGFSLSWSNYTKIIKNNITDNTDNGVSISSSSNTTIIFNDISNNQEDGVSIHSSHKNKLANNSITENACYGVKITASTNITIEYNNISSNDWVGVYVIDYSQNNSIIKNKILENGIHGFWLISSSNNTIMNNSISLNEFSGLVLYGSITNRILDNFITENSVHGLQLSNSSKNTINGNTLSRNGYSEEACIILHAHSDSNIVLNNTIIDNYYDGIEVAFSFNNTIERNIIKNNTLGIDIWYSPFNRIENNTIHHNHDLGIHLFHSTNISIESNTMERNGLFIFGSEIKEWMHNVADDNRLNNKRIGYFWGRIEEDLESEEYSQIILANCSSMHIENRNFEDVSVGIQIGYSIKISVSNCVTAHNSRYGIHVYNSTMNVIISNLISENSQYGIYIDRNSSRNLIYKNIIKYNNQSNAIDDGFENNWNSTEIGNFWSDYGNSRFYHIPGISESVDNFAFRFPIEYDIPTINHPSDIDCDDDTNQIQIVWNPIDSYPSHYSIRLNNTIILIDSWEGDSIVFDVSISYIGYYNYTIKVFDTSGNWISDTVLVNVTRSSVTTSTTTTSTTTTAFTDTDTTTSANTETTDAEQINPTPLTIVFGLSIGILSLILVGYYAKKR